MTGSNGRPWDWSDDAGDTIVSEQAAIACYTNPAGDVVLRQRGAWNDDDDAWIWFSPEHARAVAKAILEVAGYEATAQAPGPPGGSIKAKPEPDLFDRNTAKRNGQAT